jgi:hypothetical protein
VSPFPLSQHFVAQPFAGAAVSLSVRGVSHLRLQSYSIFQRCASPAAKKNQFLLFLLRIAL